MLVRAQGRPWRSGKKMNQYAVSQSVSQEESWRLSAFQNKAQGGAKLLLSLLPTARRNHIHFQVHSLPGDKGHGEAERKPMEEFLQLEKEVKGKVAKQFALNLRGQEIYGLFMLVAPEVWISVQTEFCREASESRLYTTDHKWQRIIHLFKCCPAVRSTTDTKAKYSCFYR